MIKLPPKINTAMTLLKKAGFEAFVVGGAVRDSIIGVPAQDWDMTTNALPNEMEEVFEGHRLILTGLKHGTVTVIIEGVPVEVTTYRVDGEYTDNRHPDSVRFTRSIQEDLARRDFTINAIAYDPDVGFVDPFEGRNDIAAGIIRCVGDPDRRFNEDGLRILRAIRFASQLGMEIEPQTDKSIRRNACLLKGLAAERVQVELTKTLCGKNVSQVLRKYAEPLAAVMPEISPMFGFDQKNYHHDRDVWEHTLSVIESLPTEPNLRWAALLHDIGKPGSFTMDEKGVGHFYGHDKLSVELSERILARLKFDTASHERIIRLVRYHDCPITADKKVLKRLLNKHGCDCTVELIKLHMADSMGQAPAYLGRLEEYTGVMELLTDIMEENACFSLKDLAVNGHDLMALGFTGKAVGEALNLCLDAVIDETTPNDRNKLLRYIKNRF